MKNPFKNIFNNIKNKLQKIRKKNDKAPEVDKKIKIEETENELEVNKIKEPMSEQEAKRRCSLLLRNLGNNFNFSSIAEMKDFTKAMIDKYLRSNYSNIEEKYINFAEYSIIKELFTKPNFKLPDVKIKELNVYFPNKLTNELILEKQDESNDRREINRNFIDILKVYDAILGKEKAENMLKKYTEILEKEEAQEVFNDYYKHKEKQKKSEVQEYYELREKMNENNDKMFERFFEEDNKTPEDDITWYHDNCGLSIKDDSIANDTIEEGPRANTPKASIIPQFMHKRATAELGQQ